MTALCSTLERARRGSAVTLQAIAYELRKATAFRVGFLVREVFRGAEKPLVMIAVYAALFRGSGGEAINGWSFPDLVRYLLMVATLEKLVFHNRALELSELIFEGYITKYLVMPVRFATLARARFLQFTAVQLGVAAGFYAAGLLLVPAWWPRPVSPLAAVEALVLVLLGSYCLFLVFFILSSLAFWLDVVWTLLVAAMFVADFSRGVLIPVAIMPPLVRDVLQAFFPYWTLSAPIEIFTGKLPPEAFLDGLRVVLPSLAVLEVARAVVWRRGLRRYTGVGM